MWKKPQLSLTDFNNHKLNDFEKVESPIISLEALRDIEEYEAKGLFRCAGHPCSKCLGCVYAVEVPADPSTGIYFADVKDCSNPSIKEPVEDLAKILG